MTNQEKIERMGPAARGNLSVVIAANGSEIAKLVISGQVGAIRALGAVEAADLCIEVARRFEAARDAFGRMERAGPIEDDATARTTITAFFGDDDMDVVRARLLRAVHELALTSTLGRAAPKN